MKIYRPGLPVTYVDEAAPVEAKPAADVLPSVAEAIAKANARQAQVLAYTRAGASGPSPLIDHNGPQPHSINQKPEVPK